MSYLSLFNIFNQIKTAPKLSDCKEIVPYDYFSKQKINLPETNQNIFNKTDIVPTTKVSNFGAISAGITTVVKKTTTLQGFVEMVTRCVIAQVISIPLFFGFRIFILNRTLEEALCEFMEPITAFYFEYIFVRKT